MKAYPGYKDSGVVWLGDIPEHWNIRRTKYILKETDRHSNDGTEQLLSVSQYTGVTPRKKKDNSDTVDSRASSLVGYKVVQENDLVINIMLAWNGSLGVSPYSGIVSPAYCIYRFSTEVLPKYYHYLFKTDLYKSTFKTYSTGVIESRLRLYSDKLGRIESLIPFLDEQQQISRYLDWQTSKINQFIKAKKKLIALLKEQKQNIVHHTITRGLDQNVELKSSDIEWLGDVPKHWDVIRVGNIINLTTGFPFPSAGFSQNKEDTKLLRGVNVTPSGIRWDSVVYWKRTLDDGLDHFQLREGDIVLGMDRPIISSGVRASKIGSNDTGSLLLQRVARLRPNSNVIGDFLLLLISSQMFADYMAPIFTGVSVPHLSPDQICKYKVALPPVNEQKLIINHIEKETALIDKTIARTEREIELIQEYHTRLVSDVVTGKVDVRSVEVPDFDPVEADPEAQDYEESEDELIPEGIEE